MESDRIKKAEELSRGNVYLKQAIICLWNLGIKDFTLGFGDASKKELPYVCFPINSQTLKFVSDLYNLCITYLQDKAQINIYSENKGCYMNISTLEVYKNVLYGLIIKNEVENKNKPYVQNDIIACLIHLARVFSNPNLKNPVACKLSVTSKQMFLGIGVEDSNFACNDACSDISECSESIKNSGRFTYGTYKCDRNSLVSFTNVILEKTKGKQKKK